MTYATSSSPSACPWIGPVFCLREPKPIVVSTMTRVGAPVCSRACCRAAAMFEISLAASSSSSGRPALMTFQPAAWKRSGMSSVKQLSIVPSTVICQVLL